jgi:nucleotide-binding universal stress UspA family protein
MGRPAVVLALDGSPAAATAVRPARALAQQLGLPLRVLHASPQPLPDHELRERLALDPKEFDRVDIELAVGEPAECILRATADPAVQVVVLTTHGRIIEPGRRLGSVATKVIADTTDPVMLIRPEAPAPRTPLKRLLLPVDGAPKTAYALRPATDLACSLGASVDVLYVAAPGSRREELGKIEVPRYVDQPHHEWPNWAQEIAEQLCACAKVAPEVPIRVFLGQGPIGPEIARFALEHEHDAIILVRRSHFEPGRARVLRAVLDMTSCPILLVGASPG